MEAIILAGGMGTRLRSIVNDVPKPMAPVGGKPFLEYIVRMLAAQEIKKIVLSVGYKKEIIKSYFKDGKRWGIDICYSEEDSPLGTGGALKIAESVIKSDPFLMMNGDSFCPFSTRAFVDFHIKTKALISMVVSQTDNTGDFGSLILDSENKIISFKEKVLSNNRLVNAGIYLMNKKIFSMIPPCVNYSLENNLFPSLAGHSFYGYPGNEKLIDIGTPERYEKLRSFCDNEAVLTFGCL